MSEVEIIEGQARPLAIREEVERPQAALNLFGTNDPVEVIEKATRVADALKQVIVQKKLVANIQGKEYLTVEAWTTLGSMLGLYPFTEWSKPLEDGRGWEARVLVKTRDGVEIAAAEAMCTRDERSWKSRDDYALRSMAITRATSKAMRMPLGFIAVLSGFEATPEAEVPREGFDNAPRKAPTIARADNAADRERKALLKAIHAAQGAKGIADEDYRELVFAVGGDATLAIDAKDGKERPTARNLSVEGLKKLLAAVEGAK